MPLGISLVTPNLNYGKFLRRTLTSVLDQAYPALDYVVVDGGSTDETGAILREFATRGVRSEVRPGLGQYASINHGFAQTRGEIMGWVNSDDMLMPWTLRTVAEIFTAFPAVDWIVGAPAVIQADAVQEIATVRPFAREALALGLYRGGPGFGLVQQESCFWRRTLWDRAGPLREEAGLAADFELWTRFAQHAELTACAALLGGFTIHDLNRSRTQADRYQADIARVVAALPEPQRRRRAQLERWHERYVRFRPLTGVKGLVRRIGGLVEVDGPVIRRDVAANRFTLARERVCP